MFLIFCSRNFIQQLEFIVLLFKPLEPNSSLLKTLYDISSYHTSKTLFHGLKLLPPSVVQDKGKTD